MSNVNPNQPLQLIRYKEGKFEVPEETATFLKQFNNPLGVISIVGKYRTGKSLFLNKVLLKNSTFKVSPTINSCTKGLWMCRETLRSEQPG
jgi:hypothetical protein